MCAPLTKRRKFLLGLASLSLASLGAYLIPKFLRKKEDSFFVIRKSTDRGFADHGWLKSRHTFSFADYYSPTYMGFGDLRVINEDRIAGGTGFNTHPHSDMEIISYVISGSLKHQDSMGNTTVILPGEVQRMSAGTGVRHSEYNAQADSETHFLQIWILPNKQGVEPGYGQKSFEQALSENKIVHVVSSDGRDGSITMNQDANVYISRMKKDQVLPFPVDPKRRVWMQVVKGTLTVNGKSLEAGDGLAAKEVSQLDIQAQENSELILFDLA